ncbi:GNAT family N-acetyltransferase [Jidongwangia harbinensis]|uniref:GNAT family N-acetyltransferase n=1 Tax=Jidongwangia harbinensis TaxID=2878561 RepID=UPI001CD95A00|nr:N-acetyltransferase [Jidongwangia harbinensis]MCA2211813.1 N-acetyltransferase [Jidongwangia harbinensis]
MDLRAESVDDREAVLDVHRRAFGDHGATVAALVGALRADDPAALSVVAADGGRVVGHVLFTRSLLDAPRRLVDVQVLSPLAVLPDRQRRGVGAALVRHGLELLEARGVPLVFLEGDPGYYGRLGFTAAAGCGFRKPSLRIPDAAFQVVRLSAYRPWMTGTFVYSAPFWVHDCVGLREPADDGLGGLDG